MERGRGAAVRDNDFPRGPPPAAAIARRYRASQRLKAVAGLIGLCLLLWILTPHFLTVANALNVMEQTSINAIVAVGMTFVIISGGIDLSVGSLVALSGVVLAGGLKAGWAGPLAVGAGLGRGAAAGGDYRPGVPVGRLPAFFIN